MTPEIPDAAVRAAMARRADLLADSPSPMVLPDAVLVRKMIEAALPHLLPQAPDRAADLEWLLAAGLDVQVTPCGGAGRCCGDTAGRFSVRAAKPDPVAALPLPGGVESHGHASPGEALASARDWCEREGLAPVKLTPVPDPEPCRGFQWIGQPFSSCDCCGKPAWEHEGEMRLKPSAPMLGDRWELRPWKPGEAEAIRRKWEGWWPS